MNDDHHARVPTLPPPGPGPANRLRPVDGDTHRDDFAAATFPASADMYVVPFGLDNTLPVGMPGCVPVEPPTQSLFQGIPSISAIQTGAGKFYPHKHPPPATGDFKDERIFQMMSSSSFPVPVGDIYAQNYEDVGGYVEMTTVMGQEQQSGFLRRSYGTTPDLLTGYAPSQPCDEGAAGGGVFQTYGTARPSHDQFLNFDVDAAATAAALPPGSFQKAAPYSLVGPATGTESKSSHLYNQDLQQQHQLHQHHHHHHPSSLQPQPYRLPYPTPAPSRKSPTRDIPTSGTTQQQQPEAETDEINTRAVASRVAAELKRYSVPQAVFAQLVLCRSQGTLSDLLRNPKPWSKLKSGRETFRRMWKWLQEPEYQRMSALRFAGRLAGKRHYARFIVVYECRRIDSKNSA